MPPISQSTSLRPMVTDKSTQLKTVPRRKIVITVINLGIDERPCSGRLSMEVGQVIDVQSSRILSTKYVAWLCGPEVDTHGPDL